MPTFTHLALGALLSSLASKPLVLAAPQDLLPGIGNQINSQVFAQHASTATSSTTTSSLTTTSSTSTTSAAPTATGPPTVHVGNTPQSVGDLTGTDFINKILAATKPLCPDVNGANGACTGDNGEIEDVAHIAEDETLGGGTLMFNVRDSNYITNDQRDGMLALFASTMSSSASGTTNCKTTPYRSDCKTKRDPLTVGDPNAPNADCTTGTKNICSGPDNVYIELPDSSIYMNIDVTFTYPGEEFSCMSVLDLIEEGFAFLPEFDGFTKAVDVLVALAKPCCQSDGCGKTGGDRRLLRG